MKYLDQFDKEDLILWGGLGVLIYVIWKGGIAGAAEAASKAIVNVATGAVKGVVTGTVDATGQAVGLPPLSLITTDPKVSRYIMDLPEGGYIKASEYSSALALYDALKLPTGSGTPPPANSPLAVIFPAVVPQGSW